MRLVVIAAFSVVACIADTQGTPEDEAAIRKIVAEGACRAILGSNSEELLEELHLSDHIVLY